jgi:hypothetical protein
VRVSRKLPHSLECETEPAALAGLCRPEVLCGTRCILKITVVVCAPPRVGTQQPHGAWDTVSRGIPCHVSHVRHVRVRRCCGCLSARSGVRALACACVRAGVGEQTRALLHFDVAVTVAADPNIRTDAWVAWVPAHEPRVSTRAAAAYAARLSRCAPQRTPESRMLLAEYAAAPVQDAAPCASMESPCAGILD